MEVVQLTNADYKQWDEFILQSPQYNLFAHTWYLQALNIRFDIYTIQVEQQIIGGIVLTKDKWNYLINPIFCKYLGIFFGVFEGNDYAIETRKRKVLKTLLPVLKKQSSFEFTFHPKFGDWLQFHNAGFKQTTAYTYTIDLQNNSEETLLKAMNARLRNKITKAKQSGLEVKTTSANKSILELLEATYTQKGNSFPIPIDQLKKLIASLAKHQAIHLLGVYRNENLAAVLGLFYDGNTAYLILNGVNNEIKETGINELLIFEGILWAKNKGLETFDFEGSMISNIESFYRQFGGKLTPYHKIWMDSKQRTLRNLKQRIL